MKRPNKKEFLIIDTDKHKAIDKEGLEMYSNNQDKYIDYLEQLSVHNVSVSFPELPSKADLDKEFDKCISACASQSTCREHGCAEMTFKYKLNER